MRWLDGIISLGDGEGGLVFYSPWDCKDSDITEHAAIEVRFHSLETLSFLYGISSVQLLSHDRLFVTP